MEYAAWFADDGFTGTNFERPQFREMLNAIEAGRVNCVIVKDLSRFGRDYIGVGRYLERWFPAHGVRFIAPGDNIDSENGPYDMLLPVKNVINEQYARDISQKVRSSFRIKQKRGEFIGAFASYGYRKDPENHNRLLIDPPAAEVVRRIFGMFEHGTGKLRIARILNAEGIPCPSEYKRLNGEKYHNGRKLDGTTYWTYAAIHRILNNAMYAGHMEQGRAPRRTMHGAAKQLDRSQWTLVKNTHEAIIAPEQWERAQSLLKRDTRTPDFERNVSPFAGFLRCGDCGRAMSKTNRAGGAYYCCGSYKRYGPSACTRHGISQKELEQLVLRDLNRIMAAIGDLAGLAEEISAPRPGADRGAEEARARGNLERIYRLKKSAYEDYRDGLLSREDYLRYKDDYERQEAQLSRRLECLAREARPADRPWITGLLKRGELTELDRATIAETVEEILIFADGTLEIAYAFSDDMGVLSDGDT